MCVCLCMIHAGVMGVHAVSQYVSVVLEYLCVCRHIYIYMYMDGCHFLDW